MIRRQAIWLGGATVLLVIALTGCGSGESAQERSEIAENQAEIAARIAEAEAETEAQPQDSAATEAEEVEGPLSYAGTITASGHGTTFVDRYQVGPVMYGAEEELSSEVVSACASSSPAVVARSAFARGELTVTYKEGSLPTTIPIAPSLVGGEDIEIPAMAYQIGGEWQCKETMGVGSSLEFQPGESQTLPFWWIDVGVLTNDQPRLPKSTLDSWYFEPFDQFGGVEDLTPRGPGASWCEEGYIEEWRLFLYNRSGHC